MSERELAATVRDAAAKVRLLILDVDGVMTDGRLHYGPDGAEFKSFNVRDGLGMKQAQRAGIEVAIISGRGGEAVERRLQELGIRHVLLRQKDKRAALDRLLDQLGVGLDEVACVGDDTPDLAIMQPCALGITVADAHPEVLAVADWTTSLGGGRGAVREVCDLLVSIRGARGD
ncbi:MAG: HAD hydrolase family protein [Gammaproteobacteria bacterium]|nr:HAD hydrolase family protein [Gammaproteobacteria bacterium]MBT8444671.1 HAD hydrolase family protein [Gammaproteobacteria bacterium]NND35713.1 HAD hydrolase family protein [Gammaproteobacteria bacterium]